MPTGARGRLPLSRILTLLDGGWKSSASATMEKARVGAAEAPVGAPLAAVLVRWSG